VSPRPCQRTTGRVVSGIGSLEKCIWDGKESDREGPAKASRTTERRVIWRDRNNNLVVRDRWKVWSWWCVKLFTAFILIIHANSDVDWQSSPYFFRATLRSWERFAVQLVVLLNLVSLSTVLGFPLSLSFSSFSFSLVFLSTASLAAINDIGHLPTRDNSCLGCIWKLASRKRQRLRSSYFSSFIRPQISVLRFSNFLSNTHHHHHQGSF